MPPNTATASSQNGVRWSPRSMNDSAMQAPQPDLRIVSFARKAVAHGPVAPLPISYQARFRRRFPWLLWPTAREAGQTIAVG